MELGSEYNLSLSQLNIVQDNLLRYLSGYRYEMFDSGRSALKQLVSFIPKNGNILLPEFICESVIHCFPKEKLLFYNITDNFSIDIEDLHQKMNSNTAAIFLMHYFGSVQSIEMLNEIRSIADKYGILVIEDTTQSLFSAKNTIGDYMIASVRKWLPVPNAGVLYATKEKKFPDVSTLNRSSDNKRSYGMVLKDLYLKDILDCNKEYRKIFADCEMALDEQDTEYLISDYARFIISCMDINKLVEKRKENYKYLKNTLSRLGIEPACNLASEDCPFVFPMRIQNRDVFRKYLMDNKIYCAVHWPYDGIAIECRPMALRNSETLISLPIDQRYGTEEIAYMIKTISSYGGDLRC